MKQISRKIILLFFLIVLISLFPKIKQNNLNIKPNDSLEITNEALIFLGDTGTGDGTQYKVGQAIKNYCLTNNCRAVILMGDIIYNQGVSSINDKQFIDKFEKPYREVNLPFYISYGNHDYLGCTVCYLDYSSKSSKWIMTAPYYKLSFDNADIFIIDTEKFSQIQANWLKDGIDKSRATFKIVTGHRPIITYESTHAGEKWTGMDLLQKIICQKVDYYISGHSHLLEDVGRIGRCKTIQLVSGGGGAFPRKINPENKDQFYFEGNGFLSLVITKNLISTEFIDKEGNIIFRN